MKCKIRAPVQLLHPQLFGRRSLGTVLRKIRLTLNWRPLNTEIFSKRRKIYSICLEDLRWQLHQQCDGDMDRRPEDTLFTFFFLLFPFLFFWTLSWWSDCCIKRAYLPGVGVNHDHEGGSPRVRPVHCTTDRLTPTIVSNVNNSSA